jgi:anti-sigma factor RsiW
MNVCSFQPQLSAYYDGELSEEQRAHLEAHLAHCSVCAAELRSYGKLSAAMASQLPAPMPRQTLDRLKVNVRREAQQHWWRYAGAQFERTVRRVTGVAAVILVGASAAFFMVPGKAAPSARADDVIVESLASGSDSVSSSVMRSSPGSEERQMARWIVADLSQHDVVKAGFEH